MFLKKAARTERREQIAKKAARTERREQIPARTKRREQIPARTDRSPKPAIKRTHEINKYQLINRSAPNRHSCKQTKQFIPNDIFIDE